MTAGRTGEVGRQLLHVGVGAMAFLLRWLDWREAAAMAIAAIAFNRLLLPSLSRTVFRPADLARPWTTGIVLYPTAVLALILIFRDRLELAAAGWVILAAGDGVATLAGTTVRSPRWPWNADKTVAGTIGFIVAASAASAAVICWVSGRQLDAEIAMWALTASVAAGLAETIPIRLDDNVTVAAAAALVLGTLAAVDLTAIVAHVSGMGTSAWLVAGANTLVAVLGFIAGTVTVGGALAGLAIGTAIALGGGWGAWGVLLAMFVTISVTTRLRRAHKSAAGIAEDRGGRRGAPNAIANTGLAAWFCLLAAGSADQTWWLVAAMAALITAGSDTVASEVGKAFGRTAWLVTSLRRVAPGTTGAVSLEGTAAGVASAFGLSALAAAWQVLPWAAVPIITLAATGASLMEGAIGATAERSGILNNDMVNFLNAAIGAGLALSLWGWLV
jgi:uncharacterized protein (TIGR00297 family)